jgi:hypothetical protein
MEIPKTIKERERGGAHLPSATRFMDTVIGDFCMKNGFR